jgi:membrane fusion protein, protease secretion system
LAEGEASAPARLVSLTQELEHAVVRAPTDGQVQALGISHVGELTRAGEVVAAVVPQGPRRAELVVPSTARGLVAVGQDVALRLTNYPRERYIDGRGQVIKLVQRQPPGDRASRGEFQLVAVVEVKAAPRAVGGASMPVEAGMVGEALVVLDRYPMLFAVLRGIFGEQTSIPAR